MDLVVKKKLVLVERNGQAKLQDVQEFQIAAEGGSKADAAEQLGLMHTVTTMKDDILGALIYMWQTRIRN